MINISNAKEDLEKGLISLVKIGNAFAISKKQYSVDNGTEVEPLVEALDVADLKKKKEELLKAVDSFTFLIEKSEAL